MDKKDYIILILGIALILFAILLINEKSSKSRSKNIPAALAAQVQDPKQVLTVTKRDSEQILFQDYEGNCYQLIIPHSCKLRTFTHMIVPMSNIPVKSPPSGDYLFIGQNGSSRYGECNMSDNYGSSQYLMKIPPCTMSNYNLPLQNLLSTWYSAQDVVFYFQLY